ncbi:MAG: rhodanese-like domain-containing protein [Planctomycetota bacterium]|nr:rhodanese-like domain-containing protein [Planctomycetota bacterium]
MILEQHFLSCLAHASYLIADEGSGTAAIVDPQRDVDVYVESAARRGLAIRHVILTHFHADFVSGHLELARRTGATIYLGARAKAEYRFQPLADGDEIHLGGVVLRALETPGHTPESISVLVFDLASDAKNPKAVLTGDTLFLGDVGRPDLMASQGITAPALAGMLYDSLHQKLLPLPDATIVYPAHGAGSACGKKISNERCGTLGEQKKLNWALQPMTKAKFVEIATADLPPAPAYFPHAAAANKRARAVLDDVLAGELVALAPETVLTARDAGAIVLDVREPDDFARGHVAGSINVGLSGKFAHWCGTLLDRSKPLVLVAPAGKEREAALRLARVGLEQVKGYARGGYDALAAARPDLVCRFRRHTCEELAAQLSGADAPLVLDVRLPGERASKRIAKSAFVPLDELEARAREIPKDRRVVIHCAGGYRSAIAASLLMRAGHERVEDLIGGIGAWETARQPVET